MAIRFTLYICILENVGKFVVACSSLKDFMYFHVGSSNRTSFLLDIRLSQVVPFTKSYMKTMDSMFAALL